MEVHVSTPHRKGKLHLTIPTLYTPINPKNISTIPYHFNLTLLNANFDFDDSVANDLAIDVAKCELPDEVMQV